MILPTLERVKEEHKNQTPFWFFRLNPKEQKEIQAIALTHVNNRIEGEDKLVQKFKLTYERSREIINHFTASAQTGKKEKVFVPVNGNKITHKISQDKQKKKKPPCVEVISNLNLSSGAENPDKDHISPPTKKNKLPPTASTIQECNLLSPPRLQPLPKKQKKNTALSSVSSLKPGQNILVTRDRQRFYAGVKKINNIQLDFTDEQLGPFLGKNAKVISLNYEDRTVTVILVVGNDSYEVVLPIDAVDPEIHS